MKNLELRDFVTICDEFHRNFTSDQLQPARIVDALKQTYQQLFGVPSDNVLGWENKVKCGIFACEFKFFKNGMPGIPRREVEWFGVQFGCIDKNRSIRSFTKSLPEFLHFYDNPQGYFRLEQIYMNDQ